MDELQRVIGLIREKWQDTKIIVRGDSAYAREEIMNFCEYQQGVDYVIAMATNRQLKLRATNVIAKAINDYEQILEPVIELMDSLFALDEDLEIVGKIVPNSTWFRSL